MDIDKPTWQKLKWGFIKKHLHYNDEELEQFKSNPRNELLLDKSLELANKRIIITIIDAHGCNSGHKTGDKFVFDGSGNLLSKENPDKVCVFALNAAATLVYTACELFYAGVDPNTMKFKRINCFDVGLPCGGWGKIVMEISMVDKE
ncbi:MAG TPA: hypothetical protein PLP19_13985 [bacterium]|nr:hypothetical protein [bacterium]HPN44598.1 hypothetical protein [bacterium]